MSQVLVYSKRNREMSYLSTREERETKPNRFQVAYNDISDEEALRRANSINLDEKNNVPKVRLKRKAAYCSPLVRDAWISTTVSTKLSLSDTSTLPATSSMAETVSV